MKALPRDAVIWKKTKVEETRECKVFTGPVGHLKTKWFYYTGLQYLKTKLKIAIV
jgi:hypothetical protein